MSTFLKVLLVILIILVIALVVLYFVGRKMQKKQMAQQEQMEAAKQTVSMLVIECPSRKRDFRRWSSIRRQSLCAVPSFRL